MDDAQVQALMQNWRAALAKQMDDLRVRQWCLERAIEAVKASSYPGSEPIDSNKLAADYLKFITAPFAEIFHPPESPPS